MTGYAVATETSTDWASARQIQAGFMQLSRPVVDGIDYSAQCRQMDEVGGDFYHFLPLADDCLAAAIGDACGKGLPGALMVSNVQSSVRTATLFAGDDLQVTLDAVNRQVHASSLAEHYATLFCCVLNGRTGMFRYVNAGHPAAIVLRRDGSTVLLESGGAPVGMFPNWNYQEGAIELHAGDIVVAYTDGVVEALNSEGEEWGVDGIQRALTDCAGQEADEVVAAVLAALDEYTNGEQRDDATVLALRVG